MANELEARGFAPAWGNFKSIEQAVMESSRGRWFLDEYAKRVRSTETAGMLDAMGKLQSAVANSHDALAERLAKALGVITSVDSKLDGMSARAPSPAAALAPGHMKFFKQDEEIFETPEKPSTVVAMPVAKPEVPRGARLVIRRVGEAATVQPVPAPPIAEPVKAVKPAEAIAAEDPPKRRIVIIRHKPGEKIDVPMQNDFAASA